MSTGHADVKDELARRGHTACPLHGWRHINGEANVEPGVSRLRCTYTERSEDGVGNLAATLVCGWFSWRRRYGLVDCPVGWVNDACDPADALHPLYCCCGGTGKVPA